MAFSPFLQPDDSVHRWLNSALPLVAAPWSTEAVLVSPAVIRVVAEVTEAAPVVQKSRQSTNKATGNTKATDKPPRKRSQKKAGAGATAQ